MIEKNTFVAYLKAMFRDTPAEIEENCGKTLVDWVIYKSRFESGTSTIQVYDVLV